MRSVIYSNNTALIQTLDELCRILNDNAIADASSTWLISMHVPKMLSQAQRENGARITSRCSSLIVTEDDNKFYGLDGTCFVIVYSTCSEQSSCCFVSPAIPSTR